MLVLVKKKLSNSFKASGSVSERGVNVFLQIFKTEVGLFIFFMASMQISGKIVQT